MGLVRNSFHVEPADLAPDRWTIRVAPVFYVPAAFYLV